MIELRGITWDHSRAYPPLVAAGQRYEELHPGVRIRWEKRSLHEFGHMPIEQLADRFDLIVIDHPWAAYCFERNLVVDLKPHLTSEALGDLEQNCVGPSFRSYDYDGGLLALPIDAATPVPSWRADLLEKHGVEPPQKWAEIVALADARLAVMPGFPADLFLNWCMLLEALDARPFTSDQSIAETAPAHEAMDMLARMAEQMPEEIYHWNPIAIAEEMTRHDEVAYCAFAYSYGNYSRPRFAAHRLQYGDLVCLDDGRPLRSIVGGTGLAVTAQCAAPELAINFALYCAGAEVQSGLYAEAGGQPARREAWESVEANRVSGGFFAACLASHESALLRPRYDGYVPLQEEAGIPLQRYLRGEVTRAAAWEEINQRYRQSLPGGLLPAIR